MTKNDYLAHWGIRGMRWGIRRYQNLDGSRTPLGKKRRREYSEDYLDTKDLRKKRKEELSNKEIRKVNERIRLEKDYSKLNSVFVKDGKDFVLKSLSIATGGILTGYMSKYIKKMVDSLIERYFKK